MASVKKPFRFLDKAKIKIYSDLPCGTSHEGHVSHAITACEAGHMLLTHPRALDSGLDLRDPCMMT
jgi:hypothetical protein